MATTYRRVISCALLCASTASPVLASGDLDPSFGAGAGYQQVPLGQTSSGRGWLTAVRMDDAGRIIAAGHGENLISGTGFDFAVARLLADGSMDPSFGNGGLANVDLVAATDLVQSVFEAPNGRYVACGSAETPQTTPNGTLAAVRLTAGGTLDTSFDLDGRAVLHLVHPDEGTVNPAVAGGCAPVPGGGVLLYGALFRNGVSAASALLVRLAADGSLDASFGDGGMVLLDVAAGTPSLSAVSNAAVQPDGTIIASGFANVAPDTVQYDVFAARFLADGSLDPAFGDDGLRLIAFDQGGGNVDVATGQAIGPGGTIVLAATIYTDSAGYDIGLARLLANGSLDPGFGTGGRARIGFDAGGSQNDEARDVAIDGSGRVYVAGVVDVASDNTDVVVARLDGSGALDPGFADGGWMVLGLDPPLSSPREFASALVLDHDGRVVAVGSASIPEGESDGLVLRLTSDTVFGNGFEDLP